MKGKIQSEDRASHARRPPAIQQDHPDERDGGHQHQTGGTALQYPPFTRHATPSRHATPPSTTAPPTTNVRGEHTQDTPPHKGVRRHTHHCTTHPADNSTRHDSSTHTVRTKSRWHRPHTLDSAGQHCTHHRHSTAAHRRGGWTPSTHPLTLLTFTQSTNNNDQHDQRSSFNDRSMNNEQRTNMMINDHHHDEHREHDDEHMTMMQRMTCIPIPCTMHGANACRKGNTAHKRTNA